MDIENLKSEDHKFTKELIDPNNEKNQESIESDRKSTEFLQENLLKHIENIQEYSDYMNKLQQPHDQNDYMNKLQQPQNDYVNRLQQPQNDFVNKLFDSEPGIEEYISSDKKESVKTLHLPRYKYEDITNLDLEIDPRIAATIANVVKQTIIQATRTEVDNLFESDIFDINSPNDKQSIVDSKTLPEKIKKCMDALLDEDTSYAGKIKICDFICNKLCDIYRLPFDKRNIIVEELTNTVFNSEELSIPLRLYYLKFRNELVSYKTSVNLFHRGVRDKMRVVPYFQILKYILRANMEIRSETVCEEILNEFDQLFEDDEISIYTKMEIADIFLLNGRTARGNEMLDILRDLEYQLILDPEDANNAALYKRISTIYQDSQNVHTLNDSVLSACVHLMEIEPPSNGFVSSDVQSILFLESPCNAESIATVLERIEIDESRFNYNNNIFSLYDVFSSLWQYIEHHSSKQELRIRLIEEMVSMAKYCSTGHMSRFINVIQGYSGDEKLYVRITDAQQIRAVLVYYLDNAFMCADNMTTCMIDKDKIAFYEFIEKKVNYHLPKLLEEYGEVQEHVLSAIKSYSRCDEWDIKNDKLIYVREVMPEIVELIQLNDEQKNENSEEDKETEVMTKELDQETKEQEDKEMEVMPKEQEDKETEVMTEVPLVQKSHFKSLFKNLHKKCIIM